VNVVKIHEYQAKAILREFGVPTPPGVMVTDADAATKAAADMTPPVVVKAQVHVGGRGKAGGVKLARSQDEIAKHAGAILGMDIKGSTVRRLLIEPGIDIKTELYVGIVMDRAAKLPCLMVSAAGGIDIEEVAATTPEKILKIHVRPEVGLRSFLIRRAATFLGIPKAGMKTFITVMQGLYRAFVEKDCSLAEINPLVITGDEQVIACDAKINFDDNAAYRHPEYEELRDDGEEEPLEVEARKARVSYVKLDGRIGCIVNGAGLAMATMDIVKHFGGEPANFLDIGGGAKADQVTEALRIITSDRRVNTIFFNIFGGIVRCDRVAEGILTALDRLDLKIPIVIRLSGTNEEKAREMLAGTSLIACPTMSEGAKKAVEVSKREAT
jgi:succinyl-CoA synthetase beta subunit